MYDSCQTFKKRATNGPPAKRHLNGVSLAGQFLPDNYTLSEIRYQMRHQFEKSSATGHIRASFMVI